MTPLWHLLLWLVEYPVHAAICVHRLGPSEGHLADVLQSVWMPVIRIGQRILYSEGSLRLVRWRWRRGGRSGRSGWKV